MSISPTSSAQHSQFLFIASCLQLSFLSSLPTTQCTQLQNPQHISISYRQSDVTTASISVNPVSSPSLTRLHQPGVISSTSLFHLRSHPDVISISHFQFSTLDLSPSAVYVLHHQFYVHQSPKPNILGSPPSVPICSASSVHYHW